MASHNEIGEWGEDYAATYMMGKGYTICERDWHLGKRDIDIIALTEDELTVVFVEVKTRTTDELEDPAYAVTPQKMKSIGFCANAYIKEKNMEKDIRFDIITIIGNNNSDVQLEHTIDAFNPCLL